MMVPIDPERDREEARRQWQLDYNTGMKVARLEGYGEGFAEERLQGQRIGMIHFCERLLNRPETPQEQLVAMSLDDLTRLADDLQQQVQNPH